MRHRHRASLALLVAFAALGLTTPLRAQNAGSDSAPAPTTTADSAGVLWRVGGDACRENTPAGRARAITTWQEAARRYGDAGRKVDQANTLSWICRAQKELGPPEKAVESCRNALAAYEATGSVPNQAEARFGLGDLYRALTQPDLGEVLDDPALKLSADLVVLSACQTGLGNLKQAEGTVGLQRAFMARGARSMLVSLWSVSDEATAILMERFYQHWLVDLDQPAKSEALRRAQADLRATRGFDEPRYWAPFQLVGGGGSPPSDRHGGRGSPGVGGHHEGRGVVPAGRTCTGLVGLLAARDR